MAYAPDLADKPLAKKVLSTLHNTLYKVSGGKLGSNASGMTMLLLTTTGRKSGQERTVPLTYLEDAGDPILIASNFGGSSHPGWYYNLMADGPARVQIGSETFAVEAEATEGTERERLFQQAIDTFEGYAGYRDKTSRDIQVLRLRRLP